MIPLVFTSSDTKRTVTVAVAMFLGRHYTDYALLCAAGSLPPSRLSSSLCSSNAISSAD